MTTPELVGVVGARGWVFAHHSQQALDFPAPLERILDAAARRPPLSSAPSLEPTSGPAATTPVQRDGADVVAVMAQTDLQAAAYGGDADDPLFRVKIRDWALETDSIGRLRPVREPGMRILRVDHETPSLAQGVAQTDETDLLETGTSHLLVRGQAASSQPWSSTSSVHGFWS